MDAYVVKIMCAIPVKLLNNYGFKTGFHGKNLVLIWFFEHYGLVFQPSKNLATLLLNITNQYLLIIFLLL